MMAVALLSTLATMRLAIHGFEVEVPNLTGLTLSEASDRTLSKRLNLNLENSFYSTTVPAGRVLAQSPAPGTKVRKMYNVRVTQSLGPQVVNIPNVVGQQERQATINIRHLALDLGAVAYLPGRGSTTQDIVLAQSPPANAAGVDRPRVSILLSQIDAPPTPSYVMPDFVRMTYPQAVATLAITGLPMPALNSVGTPLGAETHPVDPASYIAAGTILAQSPPAGHRVTKTDTIRLTVQR